MKPKYLKVEESKLWEKVFAISKQILKDIEYLGEEEKYTYNYDLTSDANSALHSVAEAAGSLDPRDQTWQLGHARSRLFAVKSTLKLIYGMKVLDADPELMVMIDDVIKTIDIEVRHAPKMYKEWYETFDGPVRSEKE